MARCKVYPTIRTSWRVKSFGGRYGKKQNWATSEISFDTKNNTDTVRLDVEVDEKDVAHISVCLPDEFGKKTIFLDFRYFDGKLYVNDLKEDNIQINF